MFLGRKLLIEDTIFTFSTRDGTSILPGHPSHTSRSQGKSSLFTLSYFRSWSIDSAPGIREPTTYILCTALQQSSALPTEAANSNPTGLNCSLKEVRWHRGPVKVAQKIESYDGMYLNKASAFSG